MDGAPSSECKCQNRTQRVAKSATRYLVHGSIIVVSGRISIMWHKQYQTSPSYGIPCSLPVVPYAKGGDRTASKRLPVYCRDRYAADNANNDFQAFRYHRRGSSSKDFRAVPKHTPISMTSRPSSLNEIFIPSAHASWSLR